MTLLDFLEWYETSCAEINARIACTHSEVYTKVFELQRRGGSSSSNSKKGKKVFAITNSWGGNFVSKSFLLSSSHLSY